MIKSPSMLLRIHILLLQIISVDEQIPRSLHNMLIFIGSFPLCRHGMICRIHFSSTLPQKLRPLLPRDRGGCGHRLTPGLTALTGIHWSSTDLTTLLEGLQHKNRTLCKSFDAESVVSICPSSNFFFAVSNRISSSIGFVILCISQFALGFSGSCFPLPSMSGFP